MPKPTTIAIVITTDEVITHGVLTVADERVRGGGAGGFSATTGEFWGGVAGRGGDKEAGGEDVGEVGCSGDGAKPMFAGAGDGDDDGLDGAGEYEGVGDGDELDGDGDGDGDVDGLDGAGEYEGVGDGDE